MGPTSSWSHHEQWWLLLRRHPVAPSLLPIALCTSVAVSGHLHPFCLKISNLVALPGLVTLAVPSWSHWQFWESSSLSCRYSYWGLLAVLESRDVGEEVQSSCVIPASLLLIQHLEELRVPCRGSGWWLFCHCPSFQQNYLVNQEKINLGNLATFHPWCGFYRY